MMKHTWLKAAVAALIGSSALVVNAAVVFDADFQGAAITNLLPLATGDRDTILDDGTAVGAWDDNDSNVNLRYEIAADETTNKVMVFSSINNSPNVADADFDSVVNLAGSELTIGWDWMHTDEGGGGSGQAIIQLLDSSDSVVTTVLWQDGGALTVAGTSIGNFKKELLGSLSTVLSTNNWDALAMQLVITADNLEVSVGGAVQTNLTVAYSEVAALRFKSFSNRNYSQGGMWIDNIHAEAVSGGEAVFALNPGTLTDIALAAPATTAIGTVDASFVYGSGSNSVEITSIAYSNESHAVGSFACTNAIPLVLAAPQPATTPLGIQFNNGIAGLADGESASAIVRIEWTEDGSGITNLTELPVAATYENAPTTLLLNPANILNFVVGESNSNATQTLRVSYSERTAYPTGVVVTAVGFTDLTDDVFTNLTVVPFDLNDPGPSNRTLNIGFDATGFASEYAATGNVVVSWQEADSAIIQQSVLPIRGLYLDLPDATGTVSLHGTSFPSNNVTLGCNPPTKALVAVSRYGEHDSGGYAKAGQEIAGSALTAGQSVFDALVLKMRYDSELSNASGANQLQIWFGKINETTGETNETLHVDTFDCYGRKFQRNRHYKFSLSDTVDFEPSNLASNEAYAFQLWWTSDDPDNHFDIWRGNINEVDGGMHSEGDGTSTDTAFPVQMDNRRNAYDLIYALVYDNAPSVPEIGDVSVVMDGANMVMGWPGAAGTDYLVLKTDDLVEGLWTTNVVPGIDGAMSVTNDTIDPQSFYKVIVE